MIQTNYVRTLQQGAQAVEPPAVAAPPQRVPVVHRIAPELTLRAEVVGRHSRHETGPALPVQLEQFRVGPHVARVRGHEKRHVAYDSQSLGAGILLKAPALAEQEKLSKAHSLDFGSEF